jgi:hypothetical protein
MTISQSILNPTLPLNLTPQGILSDVQLVAGLLTNVSKVDVVQVLNQQTAAQIFSGARPVKAEVRETARVMDYPVETGVTLSDHRISMPTEIILTCIIPAAQYSIAYPAIRNAWNAPTLLSVQTRTGTYRNMIIAELPHDEDTDLFNAVTITIKLREVIMISGISTAAYGPNTNFIPANPALQTTVQNGLLAATNLVGSGLSYLHSATVVGFHV